MGSLSSQGAPSLGEFVPLYVCVLLSVAMAGYKIYKVVQAPISSWYIFSSAIYNIWYKSFRCFMALLVCMNGIW